MQTLEKINYWKIQCKKYRETPKSRISLLYRTAQKRSTKFNFEFDLTKEWIKEKLDNGICELSGEKFAYKNETHKSFYNPFSPSIDRINNSKGYLKENCRMILTCINFGINEWGLDLYTKIAEKVISNKKV